LKVEGPTLLVWRLHRFARVTPARRS
jgi:hypothetical protein